LCSRFLADTGLSHPKTLEKVSCVDVRLIIAEEHPLGPTDPSAPFVHFSTRVDILEHPGPGRAKTLEVRWRKRKRVSDIKWIPFDMPGATRSSLIGVGVKFWLLGRQFLLVRHKSKMGFQVEKSLIACCCGWVTVDHPICCYTQASVSHLRNTIRTADFSAFVSLRPSLTADILQYPWFREKGGEVALRGHFVRQ